jgi:hypothetical protein
MKLKSIILENEILKSSPHIKNVDKKQLQIGIKVEMKHTSNINIAKTIALQHLAENSDYYSKLGKAGLADELDESRVGDMYIEIGESIETIEAEYKKLNEIGRLNPSPELNLNLHKLKNVIVSLKKIFGNSYTFDN